MSIWFLPGSGKPKTWENCSRNPPAWWNDGGKPRRGEQQGTESEKKLKKGFLIAKQSGNPRCVKIHTGLQTAKGNPGPDVSLIMKYNGESRIRNLEETSAHLLEVRINKKLTLASNLPCPTGVLTVSGERRGSAGLETVEAKGIKSRKIRDAKDKRQSRWLQNVRIPSSWIALQHPRTDTLPAFHWFPVLSSLRAHFHDVGHTVTLYGIIQSPWLRAPCHVWDLTLSLQTGTLGHMPSSGINYSSARNASLGWKPCADLHMSKWIWQSWEDDRFRTHSRRRLPVLAYAEAGQKWLRR